MNDMCQECFQSPLVCPATLAFSCNAETKLLLMHILPWEHLVSENWDTPNGCIFPRELWTTKNYSTNDDLYCQLILTTTRLYHPDWLSLLPIVTNSPSSLIHHRLLSNVYHWVLKQHCPLVFWRLANLVCNTIDQPMNNANNKSRWLTMVNYNNNPP